MQTMSEQPSVETNIPLVEEEIDNNQTEPASEEKLEESNLVSDENSDEESDSDSEEKKVFRKREKKLKKENYRLSGQLNQMQEQLKAFQQLFDTTYKNSYEHSDKQPVSEVEKEVKNIINRQQQEAYQNILRQNEAEVMNEFVSDLKNASDRYDDFEDKITEVSQHLNDIQQKELAEILRFAPNGADVLYSLSKNPQELKRILSLNPYSRIKAFANHMIEVAKTSDNRIVSNAPKPLSGGNLKGSPPKAGSNLNTMTYEQMLEHVKSKRRPKR